ncbi:MAG: LysR substrate-binding domain-containing protein [Pseudomonadota bacterium]
MSGTLRVTAPDALAIDVLMPHIVRFCHTYPGIELNLSVENSFLDLRHREADVAIRSTNTPPEMAVGSRLCTLGTTFYGSSDYLAEHPSGMTEHYNWLMPSKGLDWFSANQWLEKNFPAALITFRSNSLSGLFKAVKYHLGVAPLPFFLADPTDELKQVMPPPKEFASELWLLTHPDLRHTARVCAFVDFLTEAIVQDKDRIEGIGRTQS